MTNVNKTDDSVDIGGKMSTKPQPDIDDLLDSMDMEFWDEVERLKFKQALYQRLASEAVTGIKPDGSIMQAVPLGVIKELLGVAEK